MSGAAPGARFSVLQLVEVVRPPWATGGYERKAARVARLREPQRQLDFSVDGTRLSLLLQDLEVAEPETSGSSDPFDLVSIADPVWPEAAAQDLQRLVGDLPRDEASWPLDPDRLPLYVCSQCADLACGAVTAVVVHDETGTTWSDFRLEDGCSGEVALLDLSALGPFRFAREFYREALLGPVSDLLALDAADRSAEREHRSTRTLGGLWHRLCRR